MFFPALKNSYIVVSVNVNSPVFFKSGCIGLMQSLLETAEDSSAEVSCSFRRLFAVLLPGILSRLARVVLDPALLHSGIKVTCLHSLSGFYPGFYLLERNRKDVEECNVKVLDNAERGLWSKYSYRLMREVGNIVF
jgi:hypothetical protein